jgi:hypothetical protein
MSAPEATATWPRRLRRIAERMAAAHVLAYPIALLWAVAAIPLTIHLSIRDIDALSGDMDAIGKLVVRRLVWPAVGAAILAHAAGLPWAFGGDAALGMRRFFWSAGLLAAAGAASAAAGWAWLFLR